jgi:DNA-binding CsgD family transcriptional regulator
MSEFIAGDWEAAEHTARLGGAMVAPVVAGRLAAAGLLVEVARGRLAEAERRWADLDSREQEDDQVVLLLGGAGVEAALWRGEPAVALRRAETALADLDRLLPHHIAAIMLAALGLAAVPEGAHEPAERLLGSAEEAAEKGIPRSGSLGVEGRAWLARARAERDRVRGEADAATWTGVLEAFGYGEPYREAEARVRRAEALLAAAGRAEDRAGAARLREEAVADLDAAVATAERLGAAPLRARAADVRERAGSRRARSGPEPAAEEAGPLTPREAAVLALVAEGRTNRQVGEVLYISEKTVSVHLSRVMAKLGAAGRTDAVAIGYERGLIPPRSTVQ